MSTPRLIPAGHRERVAARLLANRLFGSAHAARLYAWMRTPGVHTSVLLDPEVIGFVTHDDDQIQGIGVAPERRGEGHGRRLLDHALEPARPLLLQVGADNHAAQALYRSVGFVATDAAGAYPDGTPFLTMFRHAHPEPS